MNKPKYQTGDRFLQDSYYNKQLDKQTLLTIKNRVYELINAIENQQSKDPRARGLYLLVSDINEAIDQELTHSDMMTFGFYPQRFPEFWLL